MQLYLRPVWRPKQAAQNDLLRRALFPPSNSSLLAASTGGVSVVWKAVTVSDIKHLLVGVLGKESSKLILEARKLRPKQGTG